MKGSCEEEFSLLTDAAPEFYQLQFDALRNLIDAGVSVHPALMVSFSSKVSVNSFIDRLETMEKGLARQMEVEELILYPHVAKRLKKQGVHFDSAHEPDNVPEKLV